MLYGLNNAVLRLCLCKCADLIETNGKPATQFYGGGTNNFAPFVISDLLGNTLVFWSSSDINRLADIVYTVEDDGWSTPRPLHAPNEVPDLTPAAVLNPNGTIEVSWQSYDFSAGSYVTKTANVSLAEDNSNKNNDALKFIDLVNLEKNITSEFSTATTWPLYSIFCA